MALVWVLQAAPLLGLDPLDRESGAGILITATGPNGTQQIEVSLEIHQIP
jgi:hypothetical protein